MALHTVAASTRPPLQQPTYTIAVRALCEFTAKRGDLDLRFTPSPTAQEGVAGHGIVAKRRGAGYEAELSLAGSHRHLQVRGRADGFDPASNRLEEIKTFRGDLARQPANHRTLHWAQLRLYGWLLCAQRGLAEVTLALVYFDIDSQRETVLLETATADALRQHFEAQCDCFLDWAAQELAHRAARDAALTALAFPHARFRTGQRELATAVYQANRAGRCLMAQAPTGIGKTVGTIFPLLKAAPGQALDKLFFLTAKTSGRQLALDALKSLGTAHLRVLELVARDKACEHPDKACHGESCPLAQGFYDRLPAARAAAVAQGFLDKATLRDTALAHRVCPYYLGQELARWSDVVVGDYNYYFDTSALLHGLAQANQWRVSLLVDEAHNLLERGRKMYSASLDQADLKRLRQSAPPALKKSLDRLQRQWQALHQAQTGTYQAYDTIPAKFLTALQSAASDVGEHLAEHPAAVDAALQRFQFDAQHFVRLAEQFGAHSLFDIGKADARSTVLCVRNVVPAPFLAPRLAAAHAATLFSATLSPPRFYEDTLGLPANTAWIDVPAPFQAAQLSVQVARRVSTRYADRAGSLQPIAELMARQYAAAPGHYLAFFSSYDYLQQAAARFAAHAPEVPVWLQSRRMGEADQAAFLARFVPGGQGIGFAVLGGAFAEGIDLPGDRLIGAFIATLGLPQVNSVNEQIRQRMEAVFANGYDYAYLYPGLQKVVQAAGRVIRTPEDQGVLLLMDQRFARAEVQKLLPDWWTLQLA
ncbi:ATP-dependent DNA helicase [Rhodoferax koreense]|uniref:ATP-dependent DNA helicase n=1 Tax=Rhodoferax koreensis TaxID=1842727 RepID=A0A1P8JX48_9BURK|nr:ATP-dependent DNA helicase [Rhodoferax koreense]APW38315.1 ATP-dependent DNA helicase [Rhodoferax koreense]